MSRDTIAAIATPPGQGGVAIIRLSGPDAHDILRRLFRGRAEDVDVPPRRVCVGRILDGPAGHAIDDEFRVTDAAQAVIILRLKAVGGPV